MGSGTSGSCCWPLLTPAYGDAASRWSRASSLLLLIAIGFTRIVLMFVFQGILVRLAIPRILADVMIAVVMVVFALVRMSEAGVNLSAIAIPRR